MNNPPKPTYKPNVIWAITDDEDNDAYEFNPGRPYCCGLIHTGDSWCKNGCKLFIIFCVCPLIIFWLYRSGVAEELMDKAGEYLGGSCECCNKIAIVIEENLNGGIIDDVCNNDMCKNSCGFEGFFKGIINFFSSMCHPSCFGDIAEFFYNIGGGCG